MFGFHKARPIKSAAKIQRETQYFGASTFNVANGTHTRQYTTTRRHARLGLEIASRPTLHLLTLFCGDQRGRSSFSQWENDRKFCTV